MCDEYRHHHHRDHDERTDLVADLLTTDPGNHREHGKQDIDRIGNEALENLPQEWLLLFLCENVRAEFGQALFNLLGIEAVGAGI